MSKIKVFVSNYPFARDDKSPLHLLDTDQFEIIVNPLGRKLKPEETAKMAKDCDAIIAGTEDLTPLVMASKKLKLISRIGIGLDSVPLHLCKERNISVAYTPDAVTPAVSELIIGLMVSLTRFVVAADRGIREGKWTRPYGKRIEKSTVGIIGFGRVGYQVARLLTPFHPERVFVNDIIDVTGKISDLKSKGLNIEQVEKEKIFKESDIITLHLPLTSETKNIINNKTLALMNPWQFLINTSRGGLIDEHQLFTALFEKQIAGAAIDVFQHEPYQGELSNLENVILTQHMGSCSYDCRVQMETEAAESVVRYFSGQDVTRLVPPSEYRYQSIV
jgi:D-3-phosphoglycerate dehydrogenase